MEHFYKNIEGWFSYPLLYREAIERAPNDAHFVEIGSWKGASAAYMAVEIINSGKNIKFDCVDTWKGSIEHGLHATTQQEELYITFLKNIEPVKNYITAYRTYSTEAAKLYKDNSLDFVFIDAAHDYDNVLADITAWYPKVKTGGIIAGHDYHINIDMWTDVKRAVHDYFKDKIVQVSRDEASWFYVKE